MRLHKLYILFFSFTLLAFSGSSKASVDLCELALSQEFIELLLQENASNVRAEGQIIQSAIRPNMDTIRLTLKPDANSWFSMLGYNERAPQGSPLQIFKSSTFNGPSDSRALYLPSILGYRYINRHTVDIPTVSYLNRNIQRLNRALTQLELPEIPFLFRLHIGKVDILTHIEEYLEERVLPFSAQTTPQTDAPLLIVHDHAYHVAGTLFMPMEYVEHNLRVNRLIYGFVRYLKEETPKLYLEHEAIIHTHWLGSLISDSIDIGTGNLSYFLSEPKMKTDLKNALNRYTHHGQSAKQVLHTLIKDYRSPLSRSAPLFAAYRRYQASFSAEEQPAFDIQIPNQNINIERVFQRRKEIAQATHLLLGL